VGPGECKRAAALFAETYANVASRAGKIYCIYFATNDVDHSSHKVVVIGAGIGGLTAAIALKQAGFQVRVFERVEELRAIGAGITLQINAMAAMDRLGLCERLVSEGNQINEAQIRYEGKVLSRLKFATMSEPFMHPFLAIHRGRLQAALTDALGRELITLGTEVRQFEQDEEKVRIRLPTGESVEADLLVGADGIHSAIREILWGSEPLRRSGYTAWRGICPNPNLWPKDLFFEAWGEGQLFGGGAIDDENLYWFATKLVSQEDTDGDDPRAEILERFAGWQSPVPDVIRATAPDKVIRAELHDRPPRFPWGRGRVTLLGDAIHPMTPNLGQGGGQAVEDGVVLAHELKTARSIEQCLRNYEKRRYPRTKKFVNLSRNFTAMAHGQYFWARLVRATLFPWTPSSLKEFQVRKLYRFEL
jgi:2-polyprenyl-6-methoxyphenol hydroxylase-like FAD-dependent oxidoreductase